MQRPPAWATEPDVWLQAIELVQGPMPGGQQTLIHRDYHPGNVLWSDRRVSGVVDWVNTSLGSPWADVGHCRVNLAGRFGQNSAERFLDLYRTCDGGDDEYHPYWDAAAAIGGLDESWDEDRDPGHERFLAAAIARL